MIRNNFKLTFRWFLGLGVPVVAIFATGPLIAASCPEENAEALAWLDKMSHSAQEVSYNGVVTFQLGEDMQVMQVSHSVAGSAASESLTQLTGQGATVRRVEHPLDCIHPGHKLLRLGSRFDSPQSGLSSACGITGQYNLRVADGERVAGRQAVRIIISPRDMYRYGYVMELDKQTGLLLKARTVGRGDRVLERFQFANLTYSDQGLMADSVELVHEASHPDSNGHHPEPSAHSYSTGEWTVRWLPKGFMATDDAAGSDRRRTYTDGLAVFSVFLEILSNEIKPGEGVARHGGTTSYTRGMHMNGKPALVTVIGEVPVNTARMVADSIRWID